MDKYVQLVTCVVFQIWLCMEKKNEFGNTSVKDSATSAGTNEKTAVPSVEQ